MNEIFDWKYYVNKYDDLKESGITNYKRAYAHWQKCGRQENRYPNKQMEFLDKKNKNSSFLLNSSNRYIRTTNDNSSFDDSRSSLSINDKKLEFTKLTDISNDDNSQLNNNLLTNLNNNLNIMLLR